VIIGDGGFGTWQARIPESHGETVITRYTLRELLDKLGELIAGDYGQSGGALDEERYGGMSSPMPDLGNGWAPVVLTSRRGVLTYATVPLMCPAAFPYFVPAQVSEVQGG
jgi:hypothetical protein